MGVVQEKKNAAQERKGKHSQLRGGTSVRQA